MKYKFKSLFRFRHNTSVCIIVLFCLSLVGLRLGLVSTEAKTFDRIIAQVNNEIITEWELTTLVKQRSMELQRAYGVSREEAIRQAEQDRPQLLDQYIRQLLLVETALTLKDQIQVTEQEVDQRVNSFKESAGVKTEVDFLEQLKREGFSFPAFREQTKRNLMAEQLIMKRVLPKLQVRDQEIQDFFEKNRDQFPNKTDEVHLKHIFVPFQPTLEDLEISQQKVEDAIADLTLGDDFEEVAVRMVSPSRIRHEKTLGKLIALPLDEVENLSQIFQNTLSNLSSGQISSPVKSPEGYYVFRVEEKSDQQISFQYFVVPFEIGQTARAKAQEQVNQMAKKLGQGTSFDQVLQTHRQVSSTDNESDKDGKRRGGDLGFQPLSSLSPEIQKVVKVLEVGVHSQPVETPSGIHIFTVVDRQASELTKEEKEQINLYLKDQKFQKEWKVYTDLLIEHAFIKYFDPQLIAQSGVNEVGSVNE